MKPFALCVICLWLTGCDSCGGSNAKPPGDEVLGAYPLAARGVTKACTIPEIPPSLEIDAILSRLSDGGGVFFTAGGLSYDAGFDGQFFTSANSASVNYVWDGGSCGACDTLVTVENFNFALLSASQATATGLACPANPLDGGVPGENPDSGITLPRAIDGGFDAPIACGELRISITGTGFLCDPACINCQLLYSLSGKRQ